MAARDFVIGADDTATTGVGADAAAPLAGETVKVPAYADPADGPKAFVEFVNSLPAGGKVTIADTAPTSPAPKEGNLWWDSSAGSMFVYYGTAWVEVGHGQAHLTGTTDPADTLGANGDLYFKIIP